MIKFYKAGLSAIAGAAMAFVALPAVAQQSKVPSLSLTKTMVTSAKDSLVAFRNYNDKQLVYFSIILTHHCNLKSLRYRVNDEDEWQDWSLPKCNPQMPYSVDPMKDPIYFSEPPGSVSKVAVEITYKDGTKEPVWTYVPCDNAGDATCGARLEQAQ